MDIRKEIESYLDCKEATGSLLLTGEWGCGKSYLIKEIAKGFRLLAKDVCFDREYEMGFIYFWRREV